MHACGRAFPGLPRIRLLWILSLRILPLRICRARITLVGILRIALLLRDRLTAAGHARRRPWRSPEQGLERIEELRRRRNDANCDPGRDRRGNEAGNAKQSGHRAKSLIGHARGTSLINTENTAARGPLRAQASLCSLPPHPLPNPPPQAEEGADRVRRSR